MTKRDSYADAVIRGTPPKKQNNSHTPPVAMDENAMEMEAEPAQPACKPEGRVGADASDVGQHSYKWLLKISVVAGAINVAI